MFNKIHLNQQKFHHATPADTLNQSLTQIGNTISPPFSQRKIATIIHQRPVHPPKNKENQSNRDTRLKVLIHNLLMEQKQ